MLRALVERLSRDLVLTRRLPTEFGSGSLLVSPSGGLKYLFRPMSAIDPMLFRIAGRFVKPNACVWDIGANVGLFAYAAAGLAGIGGRVIALEADTWCVQLLRRSALLNAPGRAPVSVISAAVAANPGIREFQIAARARASNALKGYGHSQMGGVAETQTVISVSLDWLLEYLPAPDVLKIDVEGAEMEVVQGASRLFASHRPVVLCEVAADSRGEISRFFLAHGYVLFDADSPNLDAAQHAVANMLCIPDSQPRNATS